VKYADWFIEVSFLTERWWEGEPDEKLDVREGWQCKKCEEIFEYSYRGKYLTDIDDIVKQHCIDKHPEIAVAVTLGK
jgi:hypothetical protein